VYSGKLLMMDRGTVRNMYEFDSKNKFEKLVHLVGFIIRTKTKIQHNNSKNSQKRNKSKQKTNTTTVRKQKEKLSTGTKNS
jgi:uncharacterized spore protein YtfJ